MGYNTDYSNKADNMGSLDNKLAEYMLDGNGQEVSGKQVVYNDKLVYYNDMLVVNNGKLVNGLDDLQRDQLL